MPLYTWLATCRKIVDLYRIESEMCKTKLENEKRTNISTSQRWAASNVLHIVKAHNVPRQTLHSLSLVKPGLWLKFAVTWQFSLNRSIVTFINRIAWTAIKPSLNEYEIVFARSERSSDFTIVPSVTHSSVSLRRYCTTAWHKTRTKIVKECQIERVRGTIWWELCWNRMWAAEILIIGRYSRVVFCCCFLKRGLHQVLRPGFAVHPAETWLEESIWTNPKVLEIPNMQSKLCGYPKSRVTRTNSK